ncbi:hypothetical protein PF005_g19835 [Phytophthora fragariae]|nr:hypothetical protein PF009_g32494 [Phytophthora fragariae]KAE9188975.1 hypothetical protein PF005_g19835 [Phytophthora fragariae]
MSYYRNVKNWLLEDFPQHRHIVEQRLLKMGRILERHCLTRQQGGMVTKAPACTKADLRSLIDGLYFDASSAKEYQDAALLSIIWYALGRASDLAFIQKRNLSVGSGNVLFLRLIRAKNVGGARPLSLPRQELLHHVSAPRHHHGTGDANIPGFVCTRP